MTAGGKVWRGMVALAGALAAGDAHAEYALNLPRGVTDLSRTVYDLHMMVFWVCVAIGVVVFGAMFYALYAHRKSRHPEPGHFHENTTLEVVWTIIPFLILIGMAIPATVVLVQMEDASSPELTIKVTGYQWRWQYDYIDDGVSFFSNLASTSRDVIEGDPSGVPNYLLEVDNPVVVPVDTRIRFLVTANDVIHSWWVPALGWKQDAVPGFINDAWAKIDEPGIYRGQCAELCGRDHGFMPIVLEAKTRPDYDAWLAQQKKTAAAAASGVDREWKPEELMAQGQKVFETYCVACHQKNGQGIPGAFPTMVGSPIVTGPVAGHLDTVLNGMPGTAMQAFGLQLNDVDIAAVVSYERNAFGNATGDYVQPRDVQAARR